MTPIKLGIIGANPNAGWARFSHVPALKALPQFQLTAVATTKAESAAAAAAAFGAQHAFTDARSLAACPDVDMVVVSVRAPAHFEAACEALSHGKHLFCEWPVGANLAQTQEIQARAEAAGVRAFASLQARAAPPARHARDLLSSGYVGRPLSASVYGAFSYWGDPVASAYTADIDAGANILTIPAGHGLDLMTWLLGEAADVVGVEARFRDTAMTADLKTEVALTAPEQFAAVGLLRSGAVFSTHFVGAAPRGEVFQLRIVGDRGELTIDSDGMPEIAPLRLSGTQDKTAPQPIPTPESYFSGAEGVGGPSLNIAHLYARIAADLTTGGHEAPDIVSALKSRALLDAIHRSAVAGGRTAL